MRGKKYQVSVDKLTVCYKATDEVIKFLSEITKYEYPEGGCFRLSKSDSSMFENSLKIEIINPNTNRYMTFGRLAFNKKLANCEQNNYLWLYFANRVFYTPFLQKTSNIIHLSEFITNHIGLEYNNITSLDLAVNSNINFAKKIKRAIFNPNLIPIINGIVRTDTDAVIEEVLYIHKGNQKRYTDISVYIKQSESKGGAEVRTYDKFDELEDDDDDKGKEYIKEWNTISHPHRIEISLKKNHIKQYLNNNQGMKRFIHYNENISIGQLLIVLSDYERGVIEYMLSDSINKLIYFQNIETKEYISVFEL